MADRKLKLFTRNCRRCDNYFETIHKYSQVCEKCKMKRGGKR